MCIHCKETPTWILTINIYNVGIHVVGIDQHSGWRCPASCCYDIIRRHNVDSHRSHFTYINSDACFLVPFNKQETFQHGHIGPAPFDGMLKMCGQCAFITPMPLLY